MNMSPGYLLTSLLLSSVGVFYMMWGKRRQQGMMRGCGLGLIICPLLLNQLPLLLAVGLALVLAPPMASRYF